MDLIVAVIGLLWLFYAYRRWSGASAGTDRRTNWFKAERMPAELRDATLYVSEHTVRCERPVALAAKSDQVYRLPGDGLTLVLVETKTRKDYRVYDRDIIQLSVLRVAIEQTADPRFRGARVSRTAYVRVVAGSSPRYVPVTLAAETVVVQAHRRYGELVSGKVAPRYSDNPAICRQCGHRPRCEQPAG